MVEVRPRQRKPPPVKTNVRLEALTVEMVPVDSIQPNEYNPNRMSDHDFDLLVRSMREDGFTQPVIVHRETRKIVDGEHRWRAAAHCQMPDIPVVFVDMSPEQMRISTLRHNRARGSEDLQLAAEVLRDLQRLGAGDWAADSLMMTQDEIDKLIADVPAPDALAADAFSAAWEPRPVTEDNSEAPRFSVEATESPAMGGSVNAMSVEALERQRAQERKLAEARTDEEREKVRSDRVFYRINLMFSDEEANLVKSVLGEKPAEKLLEMCREVEARAQTSPARTFD